MVTSHEQKIPDWLKSKLSADDLHQIAKAIHEAEAHSDGEIVPVIVRRSVPVSPIVVICVLLIWLLMAPFTGQLEGHLHWIGFIALPIALAGIGVWLGMRDSVLRLLTPSADLERLVWQRAQAEFYDEGIGRTKRATGILLLLSMSEHRAVVLADHAVAAKYPAATWQEVCDLMTSGLRRGALREGLCAAILRCGDIIKPHFPKVDGDTNELPDRLVIRDF